MKTKIKSHSDEVTGFYDEQIPKVESNQAGLTIISGDSARKNDENRYSQVFLEECRYIKKIVISHINESSSNQSDKE